MELIHYTNNDDLISMGKKNDVNFRRLAVQIDQRLKILMSDIDRIISDINDRIDDISNTVDGINDSIDDINQRIDDLEPDEGEDNEQEG